MMSQTNTGIFCELFDKRPSEEGGGNKSKRDNASKRSCQSQMPSVPSQDSSSLIRVQ